MFSFRCFIYLFIIFLFSNKWTCRKMCLHLAEIIKSEQKVTCKHVKKFMWITWDLRVCVMRALHNWKDVSQQVENMPQRHTKLFEFFERTDRRLNLSHIFNEYILNWVGWIYHWNDVSFWKIFKIKQILRLRYNRLKAFDTKKKYNNDCWSLIDAKFLNYFWLLFYVKVTLLILLFND